MKRHITLLISIFAAISLSAASHQTLNSGWEFKGERYFNWHPATVPGCVHTDLMAIGQLEDPFVMMNEKAAQWVDKENWHYRMRFDVDGALMAESNIELLFYGLDTFATVTLNGTQILSTDNMFRLWSADVKKLLKAKDNLLEICFHSPIARGIELWDKSMAATGIYYRCQNDQSKTGGIGNKRVSVFVRKAAYHFGWDWGPRLVTSGINGDVVLSGWSDVKMENPHYRTLAIEKGRARMRYEADITAERDINCRLVIKDGAKILTSKEVALKRGTNSVSTEWMLKNPKLWWCNGVGEPHLYKWQAEIVCDNRTLVSENSLVGVRTFAIEEQPDEQGASFRFVLNGKPIFSKGTNYIPQDLFTNRVSDARYEKLLTAAVEANMNTIRVWGGGIYERECFYEICDKLGLLVWQDFMFSCSLYPAEGALLENIKHEAEYQVRRLRQHPSVVIWCGNNECEDNYYNMRKNKKKLHTAGQIEYAAKQFCAQYNTIGEVCAKLSPDLPYRVSSPFSGEYFVKPNGTKGDFHYWTVWAGRVGLDGFIRKRARFFSEYGYQSYPFYETIAKFIPREEDRHTMHDAMLWHQKAAKPLVADSRLKRYNAQYYPAAKTLKDTLYVSRILQSDAFKMAIEAHRRDKGYCWGSLLWKLNDCWPVTSSTAIDYYGNWKPMHYATRRAFENLIISPYVLDGKVGVSLVSDEMTRSDGRATIEVVDFEGNRLYSKSFTTSAKANAATPIFDAAVTELLRNPADTVRCYLHTRFENKSGKVCENNTFFAFNKHLQLPQANIRHTIKAVGENRYEITVSTDKFVRALELHAADNGDLLHFSDNWFDLAAGESRTVSVKTKLSLEDFSKALSIRGLHNVGK